MADARVEDMGRVGLYRGNVGSDLIQVDGRHRWSSVWGSAKYCLVQNLPKSMSYYCNKERNHTGHAIPVKNGQRRRARAEAGVI